MLKTKNNTKKQKKKERISCFDFLVLERENNQGIAIKDMWKYDFETMNNKHGYIQWLFPTDELSSRNPKAPTISEDFYKCLQFDPEYKITLRSNIMQSFVNFLSFLGLEHKGMAIIKGPMYIERSQDWLKPNNHNFLRISRILQCLILMDLKPQAELFYKSLKNIYEESAENQSIISDSFDYWSNIVFEN